MYEIFAKLMEDHGYTAYKVSKDTGIPQSTLSSWKAGNSTPQAERLKILADYFGVSIEYLITGKEGRHKTKEEELAEILTRMPYLMDLLDVAMQAPKETVISVTAMLSTLIPKADSAAS